MVCILFIAVNPTMIGFLIIFKIYVSIYTVL